jgi:hypothetical protein
MKKIISALLLLVVIITSLCACNSLDSDNHNTTEEFLHSASDITENYSNSNYNDTPHVNKIIDIRSIDELEKMKKMLLCEDEAQLNEYLASSQNGAVSIEDLKMFLSLADSFMFVNVVEGELSWMYYHDGFSVDTGKRTEVFYIEFRAPNGDWIRYEYLLSAKEPSTDVIKDSAFFDKPLIGTNQKIALLSEERKAHSSGVGEVVIWNADIDGVRGFIFQYSTSEGQITADSIINGTLIKGFDTE